MATKQSLKNIIGVLNKTRKELDMCARRLDVVLADLLEYVAQERNGGSEPSRQAKKQKRRTA